MIQIRPYQPGDDEGIKALINAVLEEYEIGVTVDEAQDIRNISRYYDFNNGGGFWVLEDEGNVVGTIALHRIDDEVCCFARFYLHKDYRGKGWGSKLWHHRAEYLTSLPYKKAYATTHHKFQRAIRFYDSHGYERVKKEEFPEEVRWADIFYVKSLA